MDWDERSPKEQELIAQAETDSGKKRPAGKLLRWLPKPGDPDAFEQRLLATLEQQGRLDRSPNTREPDLNEAHPHATEQSPPSATGHPQPVENPPSRPLLRFQSKGMQAWGRWLMSTHRRPERGGHDSDG